MAEGIAVRQMDCGGERMFVCGRISSYYKVTPKALYRRHINEKIPDEINRRGFESVFD